MSDGACRRISVEPGECTSPSVESFDGVWRIRSTEAVRQILRERDATTQAGFNSESIPDGTMADQPILFVDGQPHRQQRSKIARFFAPKTVATRYRGLMESRADALVAEMAAKGGARLDDVSLRYSTEVAAKVIGLTDSRRRGLARRLERLLDQPVYDPASDRAEGPVRATLRALRGAAPMAWFYFWDVRPAIRARRRQPQEDVISHLIDEGYGAPAILIECVTYGAAGMATTREFISMAALHLLRDDALRSRYVVAPDDERHAILHEILRLEPIIGHLYRRAEKEFTFTDAGATHTVRAGQLLDLHIRQANADPATVGDSPLDLCPGRELPRGIGPEVMSFGDGPHKCPGNALAIQESDILLTRLFAHPVSLVGEPALGWDEVISGYALRNVRIAVG
ncbi:cytochrome P450 [Tessaracoccus sp. MC1756]|uniref:cytochrome P450 n=1 Tax=Tessaracoccus sp. MC1756 TaxID=2760311 RepID=UPI0016019CE8|nr:cytochrome P450 [Tessaracoccus sp. MC1756]MBB1509999.1 cytochrome P450 [Tessaracoccus sp. MC1756]